MSAAAPARRSSASLSRTRRCGAFALLMVAEFLYGWAWNSADVLRPNIRAEFGLSLLQVGSFYTAQAAGALVGALFIGQVADRIGRRNTLIGIVVGLALVLGLATVARDYPQLFAQRVVLGLVLGGAQPVVASLYIGLFPTRVRGRLAALINAGFTASMLGLSAGIAMLAAPTEWRTLIWLGALVPLLVAPLFLLVPSDRVYAGYDDDAVPITASETLRVPVLGLFTPALWRFTLMLLAMAGLNYFAAQAFTGWTASFLTEVRRFAPVDIAAILSLQATGSLIGGFFWGWYGDRFGRRSSVIGYVVGAALMAVYLFGVADPGLYRIVSFAVGFAIAANVVWMPWMAEIFPERVRATALSVFNWGRIVSLFAPLVTGAIAGSYGLAGAMLLGPVALLLVTLLWRRFPETLRG